MTPPPGGGGGEDAPAGGGGGGGSGSGPPHRRGGGGRGGEGRGGLLGRSTTTSTSALEIAPAVAVAPDRTTTTTSSNAPTSSSNVVLRLPLLRAVLAATNSSEGTTRGTNTNTDTDTTTATAVTAEAAADTAVTDATSATLTAMETASSEGGGGGKDGAVTVALSAAVAAEAEAAHKTINDSSSLSSPSDALDASRQYLRTLARRIRAAEIISTFLVASSSSSSSGARRGNGQHDSSSKSIHAARGTNKRSRGSESASASSHKRRKKNQQPASKRTMIPSPTARVPLSRPRSPDVLSWMLHSTDPRERAEVALHLLRNTASSSWAGAAATHVGGDIDNVAHDQFVLKNVFLRSLCARSCRGQQSLEVAGMLQLVPSQLYCRDDLERLVRQLGAGGGGGVHNITNRQRDVAVLAVISHLLLEVTVPTPTPAPTITTSATTAQVAKFAIDLAQIRQDRWLWNVPREPALEAGTMDKMITDPTNKNNNSNNDNDNGDSMSPLAVLVLSRCRYRQLSTTVETSSSSAAAAASSVDWCRRVLSLLLDPERTPRCRTERKSTISTSSSALAAASTPATTTTTTTAGGSAASLAAAETALAARAAAPTSDLEALDASRGGVEGLGRAGESGENQRGDDDDDDEDDDDDDLEDEEDMDDEDDDHYEAEVMSIHHSESDEDDEAMSLRDADETTDDHHHPPVGEEEQDEDGGGADARTGRLCDGDDDRTEEAEGPPPLLPRAGSGESNTNAGGGGNPDTGRGIELVADNGNANNEEVDADDDEEDEGGGEDENEEGEDDDEEVDEEDDDEENEEEDEDDDEDDMDHVHDMDDDAMEIQLEDLDEAAFVFHHVSSSSSAMNRGESRSATATGAARNLSSGSTGEAVTGSIRSTPLGQAQIYHRKHLLLRASMQVLCALYPHMHHQHAKPPRRDFLDVEGESVLVEGMNAILVPPQKPNTSKIVLRRAPTQEEYFRGSLSRNPITIASLAKYQVASNRGGGEPTVGDLRTHIANELSMADSAELLEILVAGKILDVSLKLRVVHQVLWRNHLLETPSSAASALPTMLSSGGLSMIFSSSLSERLASARSGGGGSISVNTPLSALPSMVATYRLAGVDGEATEDTVTTLADPEESKEHSWEWTKDVVGGRGIFVLLRSIQHTVADALRRIRRDDVIDPTCAGPTKYHARDRFRTSPPPAPLILLQHCCHLPANRKLLLQARAPTVLLTLLLDTLKVLAGIDRPEGDHAESNPTAEALQQLIESLTGDLSDSTPPVQTPAPSSAAQESPEDAYESDAAEDAASMPLLLQALETSLLSPPLRLLIARLLPFLTYGQADLSKTLASHFSGNVQVDLLGECERFPDRHVLMNVFVQTAVSLPANSVCNALRMELMPLVTDLLGFISKEMPKQPPPGSPALWSKNKKPPKRLESQWQAYLERDGLKTAFRIMIGVCKDFAPLQSRVNKPDWLRGVHWIESTSESVGLLAEEFLDNLVAADSVKKTVEGLRAKTRQRKKELADERRAQALRKMGGFVGKLAVEASPMPPPAASSAAETAAMASPSSASGGVRSAAASILAPVLGLFASSEASTSTRTATARSSSSTNPTDATAASQPKEIAQAGGDTKKPAWLAEMEAMEDEEGLVCSVCQEGRTLQPEELLGLYAYVKKVIVQEPMNRAGIDGTLLLKTLPPSLPSSLTGDPMMEEWFLIGKAAAESLSSDSSTSSTSSSSSSSALARRNASFVTTVSAGNAIHFSCHRRARLADRNNPKAPKSEWEGALLRNNRVTCNVILPLVSCQSSRVPLLAVDSALTDHQSAVSNLLGTSQKSMLWTCLHDVRFLLLRMAYGESLNADCGGGSLASNCQLVYYQLQIADTFDKDAQVDQPFQSSHARGLAPAFLAACAMTGPVVSSVLIRAVADSAPMAALTGILFGSPHNDGGSNHAAVATSSSSSATAAAASAGAAAPASSASSGGKTLWLLGKLHFLRGLVMCAGRRHALGLDGSGCQRVTSSTRSSRMASALSRSAPPPPPDEWELLAGVGGDDDDEAGDDGASARLRSARMRSRRSPPTAASGSGGSDKSQTLAEDFLSALRPVLTYYAMMDHLSTTFAPTMADVAVEDAANELASKMERLRDASTYAELMELCHLSSVATSEDVLGWLQKGMVAAA